MHDAWFQIQQLHKARLRLVEPLRAAEQEKDAQEPESAELILSEATDAVVNFLQDRSRKHGAELAADSETPANRDPRAAEDALLRRFTEEVLADARFDESAALLSEPLLSPAREDSAHRSLRMNCSIASQAFAFWIAAFPGSRPPLRVALSAQHAWIVLPATRRAVDLSSPGSVEDMTVSEAELGGSQLFATPHGAPGATSLNPGDGVSVLATQRTISDLVAVLNGPRAAPAVAEALARVVSDAVEPPTPHIRPAVAAACATGTTLWLQAGNALAGPLLARCSPRSPASAATASACASLLSALRRAYAHLCASDPAAEGGVARGGEAALGDGSSVLATGLALLREGGDAAPPATQAAIHSLAAACLVVAHSRSPPFLSPLRDLAHHCAAAVAAVDAPARPQWVAAARGARAALLQRTMSVYGAAVLTTDGVTASRCFAQTSGSSGDSAQGSGAEEASPLSSACCAALDVHRADALLCASLVVSSVRESGEEHLRQSDPLRVLCVLRLVRSLVREPKPDSGISGVCPDRLVGDAPGSGDAAFLVRHEWLLGPAVEACDDGSRLPPLPEREEVAPDTGIAGTTGMPAPWWEGVPAGEAIGLAGGVYQVRQHQQAGTAYLDAAADWHREGMLAWKALGVPNDVCARAAPPRVIPAAEPAPTADSEQQPADSGAADEGPNCLDTAPLPAFSCLTCGVARSALCAHCAQHCHRALGHDVTAVGSKTGVWCGCGHHSLFASACLLAAPSSAADAAGDPGLVAAPAPSADAMRQCGSFGYRSHPPLYCLPGSRCQLGGVDRLGTEAAESGVVVRWPAGCAALAWEQDGDSFLIQVSEGNEAGVLEMLQCGECAEWYHPCCAFPTRAEYEEWKGAGADDGFTCPLCQDAPEQEAGAAETRCRPRSESNERMAAEEADGRVEQPLQS